MQRAGNLDLSLSLGGCWEDTGSIHQRGRKYLYDECTTKCESYFGLVVVILSNRLFNVYFNMKAQKKNMIIFGFSLVKIYRDFTVGHDCTNEEFHRKENKADH